MNLGIELMFVGIMTFLTMDLAARFTKMRTLN